MKPAQLQFSVRSDGIILARQPAVDTDAPPLGPKSPLMEAIAKGDAGYFRGYSTIDQIERFYAFRKVADFPIYVGFGVSVNRVLQEWHRHLLVNGVFFALGTIALALLAFVAEQRMCELDELNMALNHRTSALEIANSELENFSYSTSHVLRAPLRAIDGFSQLLLDGHSAELDSEGKRLIGVLRSSASELNEQINGILEFLRLGHNKMSSGTTNMTEAVQTALEKLMPKTCDREIDIEIAALPNAFGDAVMIERVWAIFEDNAIKFTAPRSEAKIEVGILSQDGGTSYYVRDNGVGFDTRFAGKLFGVFSRLHGADFSGNGVGLAIVRRIISRHGGRVGPEASPMKVPSFTSAHGGGEAACLTIM